MPFICPLCNGLAAMTATCPDCGYVLENAGKKKTTPGLTALTVPLTNILQLSPRVFLPAANMSCSVRIVMKLIYIMSTPGRRLDGWG